MAGFIYIMSNPSFVPNLIKIGKSDRDPTEFRAKELAATGIPDPFVVEFFALVNNHHELERKIHDRLDDRRRNRNREFFDCPILEAVKAIQAVGFNEIKYQEFVGAARGQLPNASPTTAAAPRPLPKLTPTPEIEFRDRELPKGEGEICTTGGKMSFDRFRHIMSVNFGLSTEERSIRHRGKTLQVVEGMSSLREVFERLAREGRFRTL